MNIEMREPTVVFDIYISFICDRNSNLLVFFFSYFSFSKCSIIYSHRCWRDFTMMVGCSVRNASNEFDVAGDTAYFASVIQIHFLSGIFHRIKTFSMKWKWNILTSAPREGYQLSFIVLSRFRATAGSGFE